jgi:hypothetical protein
VDLVSPHENIKKKLEISLVAQALESWVRMPLEAWMSVYNCSMFVLSCIDSGLAAGRSPVQGILPTVYKIHSFRINSDWGQAREPSS